MKLSYLFLILHFLLSGFIVNSQENNQCDDKINNTTLLAGWFDFIPYSYSTLTPSGIKISGMDIDITNAITNKIGANIKYDEINWAQYVQEIKLGTKDITSGATYSEERAKFAYFSIPYRFEEDFLFTTKNNQKILEFRDVHEFTKQLRLFNYRIGVINGFVYGDATFNNFIFDATNDDIVYQFITEQAALGALLRHEIDGFVTDRIVGASIAMKNGVANNIQEVNLGIKIPISFMFSKASVPESLVENFNKEIQKFVIGHEYKEIIKEYIYPVLLIETINAEWFFIVCIIGTIAFAVSGVVIAAKENSTLFGAFIFATMPAVGGGMLRDIMINRGEVIGLFLTPIYMYYIFLVVIVGFLIVRVFKNYGPKFKDEEYMYKILDNMLIFFDALGQAAFIVTGVVVVVIERVEPLWLWGPFFAFLSSHGGSIIRDLMRKHRMVTCVFGEISPEISILWGFLFGVFLDYSAHNPTPSTIKLLVTLVVIGSFLTKLIAHYTKLPNIYFRPEKYNK